MKTKATFLTSTVTKNEYKEDVHSYTEAFSTGCEISTVRFKDKLTHTQFRDGVQLYCKTRKNPNTSSVRSNDKVLIKGQPYLVVGIDPMVDDFSKILFFLDKEEADT